MTKTIEEIRKARGITNTSALDSAYQAILRELPLAAIRRAGGLTQKQMAERLGKTQPAVSKFEGQGDFLCSTLFKYARSVGARIEVSIAIQGQNFLLEESCSDGQSNFSLADLKSRHSSAIYGSEKIANFHSYANRARKSSANLKAVATSQGWRQKSHGHSVGLSFNFVEALIQMAPKDEKQSATA